MNKQSSPRKELLERINDDWRRKIASSRRGHCLELSSVFVRSTSRHFSQSRKRQATTLARGFLQSPVAACVSSLVDLGFPTRLDGQQQPYFIPWYTVAHGGDPAARFKSRWAFYLPNSSSARRLPPSGPRTARPVQLCRSVVPPAA